MNETLPPLPLLPDPRELGEYYNGTPIKGFDADQMHQYAEAYARAAIQAIAPVPAVPEVGAVINAIVEIAHRKGELWERCQGRHWPQRESDEFTNLRDEKLPAAISRLQQDNWQQYATERETTAQAVIERHRGEHESLLRLLAEARRLQQEGGACARCGAWVCDPVISQQEPAQDEPVMWSVTCNGEHCGNVYPSENEAKMAKAFRDKAYPSDLRGVVPLFTRPQASKPNVGVEPPRSGRLE